MNQIHFMESLSKQQQRYLPVLLAVAIFMNILDATILNTALPAIAADLHESPLNMQLAIIAYTLTLTLFMPLSAYLADRYGTKNIYLYSLLLFGFGSLFCALSPSLPVLIAARSLQGLGGALLTPVARLALIKAYSREHLLRVMNYAIMPALVGPILGPLIGGYLVELASWHWIFIINLPFAIIGIILGYYLMPNFYENNSTLDVKGFFLFAGSVFLLTLGFEFSTYPHGIILLNLCLLLGIYLFYLYWQHARQQTNAIFPLHLLDIRTFRIGLFGSMISRIGISAIPFLLPLFLQIDLGYKASTAAWVLVPMALAGLSIKPLIVSILKRFNYRRTLIANTLLIGFLIISLAFSASNTSLFQVVIIITVLGACNSLQFSGMGTLALAKLRHYQTSSGNSLLSVNQNLAIVFGTALSAGILRFLSQQSWTENLHQTFQWTFIIVGTITILSVFIFIRLHRNDGSNLFNKA